MIHSWGAGGQPALCLHCSLATGRAWAGLARALPDMHVIAPDLLGHGAATDPVAGVDHHDQMTDAVAPLLPQAHGVLIGHSLGATIALRLAIEQPSLVRELILVEPVLFAAAGQGEGRRKTDAAVSPMADYLAAGDREKALAVFLAQWGVAGAEPKGRQLAYMVDRIDLITAQNETLHKDRAGILARLDCVQARVLLVSGDQSPPVMPEIMAGLEKGLRNASSQVTPGAGHQLPLTHTEALAGMVRDHLSARPRSGP